MLLLIRTIFRCLKIYKSFLFFSFSTNRSLTIELSTADKNFNFRFILVFYPKRPPGVASEHSYLAARPSAGFSCSRVDRCKSGCIPTAWTPRFRRTWASCLRPCLWWWNSGVNGARLLRSLAPRRCTGEKPETASCLINSFFFESFWERFLQQSRKYLSFTYASNNQALARYIQ